MSEKTFLKITNRDIYDEVIEIKKKTVDIEKHVLKTNGNVRVNKWVGRTALGLITGLLLALSIRAAVGG